MTRPGGAGAVDVDRFAAARDMLRRAVLARDAARMACASADKQILWQRLVTGHWSVLDVFSAGEMRYVIAHKSSPEDIPLHALPERECCVLELALAGRSGKWIALELQFSESTVARTLRMALRRLGVVDAAALIGIRTAWFEPLDGLTVGSDLAIARLPPVTPSVAVLSDAERAVALGILAGKRTAAIARERGTSLRTVSNQLASLYKKLGVSSRREALAVLM